MGSAIVIGGGILGVSAAWRLAEAGMDVTLLEAGGLGQGATLASFAWLNGSAQDDRTYYRLKVDSLNEYRSIERELGHTPWLHIDGHIEWNSAANETLDARGFDGLATDDADVTGTERLRKKASRLREWGLTVDMLPIRELRNLEPDLVAPEDVEEFAYYPQEGYIEPVDTVGAFALQARRHGATVVTNAPVAEFVFDRDRVIGVRTAHGQTFLADTVVSCAGSWTDDLLRMVGIDLPMSPADGMVAISGPTAARLRSVHHNESLSLRPDGAGRIMMRNHEYDRMIDASTPLTPLPGWMDELMARAIRSLPELASTRIEAMRIATRPIPGDGLPVAGPVPGVPGLYVLMCHGAVTLGPLLGRIASREIAFDEMDARLATFRPDRLVAVSNSA